MKKEIDNQPPLGYDGNIVNDQTAIETKYEKYLAKSPEERLLERIFGTEKENEKA